MLACIPQPACRVYRKILRVVYRSIVEPENHISGRQASLARRADLWPFQYRHAGFASVPAAEISSNPTTFRTFAPSHRTTAGARGVEGNRFGPSSGGQFWRACDCLTAGPVSDLGSRFDDQEQSTHKRKGDKNAIEPKEKWKHRAPSNLHSGGDARGFGSELGA
jgi:hypothetical protein